LIAATDFAFNLAFSKMVSWNAQASKWAAQTPCFSAHTVKNLEGTTLLFFSSDRWCG